MGIYTPQKETIVAGGVRGVEAVTGRGSEAYLRRRSATVDALSAKLQTQPDMLETRVDQLTQDLATLRRQVAQFQRDEAQRQTETLAEKAQDVSGVPVVAAAGDVPDERVLRE